MTATLLYIFPLFAGDTSGLSKKVVGQCQAFKKKYKLRFLSLPFSAKDSFIKKLSGYVSYHLRCATLICRSDVVYYRISIHTLFLACFLMLYSRLTSKKCYVEHNADIVAELQLLKRHKTAAIASFVLRLFKYSHCIHISMTDEIKQLLLACGIESALNRVIQNGYFYPEFIRADVDESVIQLAKTSLSSYQKAAIFVGSDHPWVGLDRLLDTLSSEASLCLFVVGDYNKQAKADNVVYLGACNYSTLTKLYELCHFGCGPFAFDKKNMYESCTLKAREYLFHGLALFMNHKDMAESIQPLEPYVFNINTDDKALTQLMHFDYSASELKRLANTHLSWDALLADI